MTLIAHCDWCPKQLYFDELLEAKWIVNPEEELHFCSQTCADGWWADFAKDHGLLE